MAVEGAARVRRLLAQIPAKVQEAAQRSLEQSAEEIVQLMRRLAPRDSGALANSIGWTWGDAPAGSMTLGTVKGGKASGSIYGSMVITIYAGGKITGADDFYARFQEFGTRKMRANPFFYPAYRANKKRVRSRLTRAIRKALNDT